MSWLLSLGFCSMPGASMNQQDIKLARSWFVEGEASVSEIARRLKRSPSTVSRPLTKKSHAKKNCRPMLFTPAAVALLSSRLEALVAKADGKHQVTYSMLKRTFRYKASTRTLARILRAQGVAFRKMREKPVLTTNDITERKAFAAEYKSKPKSFWTDCVQLVIDCVQPRYQQPQGSRGQRGGEGHGWQSG